MQDRYAGDVGDFGKLGFLRTMFPSAERRLGIAWWLVPDETHERVKNDGRHVGYLSQPQRFQHLDAELFRQLGVVVAGRRSVAALRDADVLPGAIHHDRRFDFGDTPANSPSGRLKRRALRSAWVEDALRTTASCEGVFLDPDNGIASDGLLPHHGTAPKFVFLDELSAFLSRPQIVVAYHHADRSGSHGEQAQRLLRLAREVVGGDGYAGVLRFAPFSPRFFVVMAKGARRADAQRRVSAFMATKWSSVFEVAS